MLLLLVVYSGKEGEVAEDDADGVNSPLARAFVQHLAVPGIINASTCR